MRNWLTISLLSAFAFIFLDVNAQSFQNFGQSKLPLISINTNGLAIPDDPKIDAQMGIVWNGSGTMNLSTDPFNDYNGPIAIELRGSSSQGFPKKSYGLELRDEAGQDTSLSLLGLPKEEDWILYAPYSDKSLIRNVLIFTLDASLGHYSPRCRFVELFLNGSYQGVYVLMEKIKRDNERVDIIRLNPGEDAEPDVSGGYIIKIDKQTGSGGAGWYSAYFNNGNRTYFQYEYPNSDEISPVQRQYIKSYIDQVEDALITGNLEGNNGFRSLADEDSFVDYMIMNELAKNVDGYRLSTYLYKDKNDKLKLGPIWDFNISLGNADYYNGASTSGFQFEANLGTDYWQNPFWWSKLMDDESYKQHLKNRWSELREDKLSDERIHFIVDSLVDLLESAQERNFDRWPVLGQYVWPNFYVAQTYQQEINWMGNWIDNRLAWLDQTIDGLYVGVEDGVELSADARVYPNPFVNELNVVIGSALSGVVNLQLYSMQGIKIIEKQVESHSGIFSINNSKLATLASGAYLLRVVRDNQLVYSEVVVKQ